MSALCVGVDVNTLMSLLDFPTLIPDGPSHHGQWRNSTGRTPSCSWSVCVCVPPLPPHTDLFVFWAEQMRLQARCPAPLCTVPSGGHLWVCTGQIGQTHHGSSLKTTSLVFREERCGFGRVGLCVGQLRCLSFHIFVSSRAVSFANHSSGNKRNRLTVV